MRSWIARRWPSGLAVALVLLLGAGVARGVAAASPPRVVTAPPMSASTMQQLIFVWASGTQAVQQLASGICVKERLSGTQCAAISAAVRQGWLDLARRDPASVGRLGIKANPTGRALALWRLSQHLSMIMGGRVATLLADTANVFRIITNPNWVRQAEGVIGRPIPLGTVIVWATSYLQTSLPPGYDPYKSFYAALPDAYLSEANVGDISLIPAIYQPYYAPGGKTSDWKVNILLPNLRRGPYNVLITDVGPWNEDDNWWDPNGTSATLLASCPVAATLVAPDATSNPLVNGICPNGHNLRRLYYYLLYQHGGLPFFQSVNYAPSGSFANGTSWPKLLDKFCAETVVASINNDGVTCDGGPINYNSNNGAWLREGIFDGPILNQSSIDLSPAVDAALGWVYPSSGLVDVYVGSLP